MSARAPHERRWYGEPGPGRRARAPRLVVAALACALSLAASSAHGADPKTASESFRMGAASFAKREFRAAAVFFETAHRLAPAAAALYNAGLAWDEAREPARAADALEGAFVAPGELDDKQRADALARLARLRKTLGKLVVTGRADARFRVAHVEGRAPPSKVFLSPGSHEVVMELAGVTTRKTVTVEAGREATLEIEASAPSPGVVTPPIDKPTAPGQPAQPDKPKPSEAGAPPRDAERGSGPSAQAGVGVGFGVLALAAAGAAVGLGVGALDARDRFVSSGNTDAGARSDADTLRTVTNVAWAGAGAFLITGVVLLATAPWGGKARKPVSTSRALPIAPVVGPFGGGVVLRVPL